MDIEKLAGALTPTEWGDMGRLMPDDLLLEELSRRNIAAPAAGGLAVRLAHEQAEDNFTDEVKKFLDPDQVLSAKEQLQLMGTFWHRLGYEMPMLNDRQAENLSYRLAFQPQWRVIPAPLLPKDKREALPDNVFSGNKQQRLATLTRLLPYNGLETLLNDPSAAVTVNTASSYWLKRNRDYALRHRTSDNFTRSQDDFLLTMSEYGRSVGKNNLSWTYPVMSIEESITPSKEPLEKVVRQIEPSVLPENLIALHLLHAINRDQGDDPEEAPLELANEMICDVSGATRPYLIAGINRGDGDVVLQYAEVDPRWQNYGIRAAVNGLSSIFPRHYSSPGRTIYK